jgi:hypothetical protein
MTSHATAHCKRVNGLLLRAQSRERGEGVTDFEFARRYAADLGERDAAVCLARLRAGGVCCK